LGRCTCVPVTTSTRANRARANIVTSRILHLAAWIFSVSSTSSRMRSSGLPG
jgi:hypothetical protein